MKSNKEIRREEITTHTCDICGKEAVNKSVWINGAWSSKHSKYSGPWNHTYDFPKGWIKVAFFNASEWVNGETGEQLVCGKKCLSKLVDESGAGK